MTTTNRIVQPLTFRAAQVTEAGGRFGVVDRELPEPHRGHVRLTVEVTTSR